jgi:hypothetical protein
VKPGERIEVRGYWHDATRIKKPQPTLSLKGEVTNAVKQAGTRALRGALLASVLTGEVKSIG